MSDGKAGRGDTLDPGTLRRIDEDLLPPGEEDVRLREECELRFDCRLGHLPPEFGWDGPLMEEALRTPATTDGDALVGHPYAGFCGDSLVPDPAWLDEVRKLGEKNPRPHEECELRVDCRLRHMSPGLGWDWALTEEALRTPATADGDALVGHPYAGFCGDSLVPDPAWLDEVRKLGEKNPRPHEECVLRADSRLMNMPPELGWDWALTEEALRTPATADDDALVGHPYAGFGWDSLAPDPAWLDEDRKLGEKNPRPHEECVLRADSRLMNMPPGLGRDGAVMREALCALVKAHGDALEGDPDARGQAAAQLLAEGLGMRLCPLDNWGRAPDSEVDDERRAILRRAEEGR